MRSRKSNKEQKNLKRKLDQTTEKLKKSAKERKYISEFLKLDCAGDVLNSFYPTTIKNLDKEIIDAMKVVEKVKNLTLVKPDKYNIVEFCSGNDLTGRLIAHLLPVKSVTSLHRRSMPITGIEVIKKFKSELLDYLELSDLNNAFDFSSESIVVCTHPPKNVKILLDEFIKKMACISHVVISEI